MKSYVNDKLKELDIQLTEYLKRYRQFDTYLCQKSILPPQALQLEDAGKRLKERISEFKEKNNLAPYNQLTVNEMLRHISSATLEINNNLNRTELNPNDIIN